MSLIKAVILIGVKKKQGDWGFFRLKKNTVGTVSYFLNVAAISNKNHHIFLSCQHQNQQDSQNTPLPTNMAKMDYASQHSQTHHVHSLSNHTHT